MSAIQTSWVDQRVTLKRYKCSFNFEGFSVFLKQDIDDDMWESIVRFTRLVSQKSYEVGHIDGRGREKNKPLDPTTMGEGLSQRRMEHVYRGSMDTNFHHTISEWAEKFVDLMDSAYDPDEDQPAGHVFDTNVKQMANIIMGFFAQGVQEGEHRAIKRVANVMLGRKD